MKNFLKMKNSLASQTFKDYEHIICLSNKSSDNTYELVKSTSCKKTIVFFENDMTKDKFSAINQSIKKINGRYLFLLHGDDFLSNQNVLEKINNFINKNNDKAIYYSNINYVNKKNCITRTWKSPNEKKLSLNNVWKIPHTGIIIDTNKVKREDLIYKTKCDISGDLEYIMELYKKYNDSFIYTGVKMINMLNTGDSSNIKNIFKQFKQDYFIFKKHFPKSSFYLTIYKKLFKISQFRG